ncbi:MAG: SAM-dependent DNA methyltransferase, partial [Bacteroidetes bacterium]
MRTLSIGAVFTPFKWANFAIEQFGLLEKWLAGARIFDPTMGEGNLLFALIESALQKGIALENLPTQNLYGAELNETHYQNFAQKATSYHLNLD